VLPTEPASQERNIIIIINILLLTVCSTEGLTATFFEDVSNDLEISPGIVK